MILRRRPASDGKCRDDLNTLYTQHVLDQLPEPSAVEDLATLTPAVRAHINLVGTYHFNVDQPLEGLRPLLSANH